MKIQQSLLKIIGAKVLAKLKLSKNIFKGKATENNRKLFVMTTN